jgi:hypothetical protein
LEAGFLDRAGGFTFESGCFRGGRKKEQGRFFFLKKKKKNCRGEKEGAGGREGGKEGMNERW